MQERRLLLALAQEGRHEVLFAEDLLGQPQQIIDLLLADADEEQAVICEKNPGELQSRVDHRQPV